MSYRDYKSLAHFHYNICKTSVEDEKTYSVILCALVWFHFMKNLWLFIGMALSLSVSSCNNFLLVDLCKILVQGFIKTTKGMLVLILGVMAPSFLELGA